MKVLSSRGRGRTARSAPFPPFPPVATARACVVRRGIYPSAIIPHARRRCACVHAGGVVACGGGECSKAEVRYALGLTITAQS
jgi:hypothetical protein